MSFNTFTSAKKALAGWLATISGEVVNLKGSQDEGRGQVAFEAVKLKAAVQRPAISSPFFSRRVVYQHIIL